MIDQDPRIKLCVDSITINCELIKAFTSLGMLDQIEYCKQRIVEQEQFIKKIADELSNDLPSSNKEG